MSEDKLTMQVAKLGEVNKNKSIIDPMAFEKGSPYSIENKKPINPMVFDAPTKSFEDKKYIVFINMEGNDDLFDGSFKICDGRTSCYRYIQNLIETFGTDLDVHESKIITETKQTESETGNTKYFMINYDEAISIYSFCKSVEGYYTDDKFDIDNYFSAPTMPINNKQFNDNIDALTYAYIASIEDPVIAKAAADTFREQYEARNQPVITLPPVESLNEGMVFDVKKDFPDLLDEDGSLNV